MPNRDVNRNIAPASDIDDTTHHTTKTHELKTHLTSLIDHFSDSTLTNLKAKNNLKNNNENSYVSEEICVLRIKKCIVAKRKYHLMVVHFLEKCYFHLREVLKVDDHLKVCRFLKETFTTPEYVTALLEGDKATLEQPIQLWLPSLADVSNEQSITVQGASVSDGFSSFTPSNPTSRQSAYGDSLAPSLQLFQASTPSTSVHHGSISQEQHHVVQALALLSRGQSVELLPSSHYPSILEKEQDDLQTLTSMPARHSVEFHSTGEEVTLTTPSMSQPSVDKLTAADVARLLFILKDGVSTEVTS